MKGKRGGNYLDRVRKGGEREVEMRPKGGGNVGIDMWYICLAYL